MNWQEFKDLVKKNRQVIEGKSSILLVFSTSFSVKFKETGDYSISSTTYTPLPEEVVTYWHLYLKFLEEKRLNDYYCELKRLKTELHEILNVNKNNKLKRKQYGLIEKTITKNKLSFLFEDLNFKKGILSKTYSNSSKKINKLIDQIKQVKFNIKLEHEKRL